MFRAGDVVKQKYGTTFSNGEKTVTVDRVEIDDQFNVGKEMVYFKETGTWLSPCQIELVNPDPVLSAMGTKLSELEVEVRDMQIALDKRKDAVDAVKATIKIWEELPRV